MLKLDHAIIVKKNDGGTASIKLIDTDTDLDIIVNKIIIDMNNATDPVGILTSHGTPVVSGTLVEDIKNTIYSTFSGYMLDLENGIYKVDKSGIDKL